MFSCNKVEQIDTIFSELEALIEKRDASAPARALEVLQLMNQPAHQHHLPAAYLHLANATDKILFNTWQAREYALLAESYIRHETPLVVQLRIYSLLATTAQALNNFTGAQQYYLQGLTLVTDEILANADTALHEVYAILNYNICILYNHIGMFRFGYDYLLIAEKHSRIAGFTRMIRYCELAIASFYYHIKDFDRALILLTPIADEPEAQDERVAIANIYAGDIHLAAGENQRALSRYERALHIRQQIGNEVRLLFSYEVLARVYYRMKDQQNGDAYFKAFLELAQKHHQVYSESHLNQVLFTLYGEKGDYQHAWEYAQRIGRPGADPVVTEEILKNFFQQEKEKQQEWAFQARALAQLNQQMEGHTKALERSNADLTSYAHTTSHDLREPLRMISTYMQILEARLSHKLTDDEKQFLHFAVDGSKRMDDMISGILQAAKGEGARRPVDLNAVLQQVKMNLSGLIDKKSARLEIPMLPVVPGNDIQLMQVFQNLISNALKYNNSDTPSVSLRVYDEGAKVIIAVADNGVGIPEQERLRVFELFSRVENASGAEGTGIGLSTVKRIMEKLGGAIWVEGNEPQGSIFKLQFLKK
ncbi:MAG: ATP-binding protein [Chitinophagales bacterium]